MNGECLNATLLQLLSQRGDDELFVIPTQTGLHSDRHRDGINNLLGYLQHLGDVLQHTSSSTLASDLLHRTAEVEVYHVRSCLFHYFGSLYHRIDVTTIDLNAHRAFHITDGEFADSRFDITHQRLSTDELGIDHRGSEPLAEQAETNVCHVLHRGEEDRTGSEVDVAYFHLKHLRNAADASHEDVYLFLGIVQGKGGTDST